jgi:hypothetical protein
MEFAKITNVFAQMDTSVKTAPYMNVLIIALSMVLATVKQESVLAIKASMELTVQKKNVKTNAQIKEFVIMILEYVNALMNSKVKIVLKKNVQKIALVMEYARMENASVSKGL